MWLLSTEKKKKAEPRSREFYFIWGYYCEFTLKDSLLESSEKLFQRGKGGDRIEEEFLLKKKKKKRNKKKNTQKPR